jgi:glutaredoxin 3
MHFIIYTKKHCPYCIKAKELLQRKEFTFKEVSVEGNDEMRELLNLATGMMTVPQIYDLRHGNKHVGGYDNLVEYLK